MSIETAKANLSMYERERCKIGAPEKSLAHRVYRYPVLPSNDLHAMLLSLALTGFSGFG
jgi:hypothetical protein